MSSQKDIASLAKVSQMTVSLALRDSPTISDITKQRVCEAARKLNYHPDPLVSALMQQRKRKVQKEARAKIAFLHDHSKDPSNWVSAEYATGCFNGAKEVAHHLGYIFEAVQVDQRQISGRR